jgi:hypothetical protein
MIVGVTPEETFPDLSQMFKIPLLPSSDFGFRTMAGSQMLCDFSCRSALWICHMLGSSDTPFGHTLLPRCSDSRTLQQMPDDQTA